MEGFKAIETQEELNAVISARLKEEKARNEKKYADYISPDDFNKKTEDLNKQIEKLQNELSGANEKISAHESLIAEKDSKIQQFELDSIKTKITAEMGFSLDAIDFLRGDNEDSIRESAMALKSLIGSRTAPLANPEGASPNSEEAAMRGMLNNLFN